MIGTRRLPAVPETTEAIDSTTIWGDYNLELESLSTVRTLTFATAIAIWRRGYRLSLDITSYSSGTYYGAVLP